MPTTLTIGDIAIIQYGSDGNTEFSFVLLKDIDADTVIKFTDKGYDAFLDLFVSLEGTLEWTSGSDLTAGTVITISADGGFNATNNTTGETAGSVTSTGDFDLSANGDSIFAYQGDLNADNLIYGVSFGDNPVTNALGIDGWNPLSILNNPHLSNLPDSLNAQLNGGVQASFGALTDIDNGYYDGIFEGSTADILASIADAANWVLSDTDLATQIFANFAVNPPPEIRSIETDPLMFEEMEGAVSISSDLDLFGSGNITGAVVSISTGFDAANDTLSFTDQNGITGVFDSQTGVLTLTGSASVSAYEAALQSVTYENAFETESTATRTVTLTITDEENETSTASRDISFVLDGVVNGTSGNDVLNSGFGADVINALAGDDQLFGEDGADILNGGDGDDFISGGDGHDQLNGGAGADTFDGGLGRDAVTYSSATAGVVLDLVSGGTEGEAAGDTFISIERISGSNFNDGLTGDNNLNIIHGLSGDDVINGMAGNDLLYGQNGADIINGGSGIDRIFGGTDDDVLRGDEGDDFLYGQAGNDEIHGGAGNDLLDGGTGSDIIYGNDGDDKIIAGTGDDTVYGGTGDDFINAGAGEDVLFGQEGNDQFIAGYGEEVFDGGSGMDSVIYSASQEAVNVSFTANISVGGAASGDTHISVENLYGSQYDDSLTGDDVNNLISGLNGDDFIDGQGGDDRLLGGSGDDDVYGGEGKDMLIAQAGNDFLDGGAGHDTLIAGTGDDIIIGGEGNDFLLGQGGADSFIFADGHGIDRIVDFEQGLDVITYQGMGVDDFSDLTLTQTGDHVLISSMFGSVTVNDSLVADFDGSDFSFENSPVNNTAQASNTNGDMTMSSPHDVMSVSPMDDMMSMAPMDDAILF
ncbi:calcium-binding protein [Hellea balneolensis]|uniref:calcium-binding protein n=1 Tax=Hellea balneolensis TaxID=287478 RepID=UPI0003F7FC45|nr:calcium-binding protein [Hellea balneolensis]